MKKIETKQDLEMWCKEVNAFNNAKTVCDLQDVYARSDMKVIKSLFLSQEQYEKELTIFCVSKTMGQEPMFRLMKAWALNQAQIVIDKEIETLDKRHQELALAELTLRDKEESYHKKIGELNEACVGHLHHIHRLEETIEIMAKNASGLQERVTELESDNERMAEYVTETNQFRTYLKGILADVTIN